MSDMNKGRATTRHVTMSIDGGILPRRNTPRALDGIFNNTATGQPLTGEELLALADELKAEGYEVIPVCDHHDEKGNCLGHPVDDNQTRKDDGV